MLGGASGCHGRERLKSSKRWPGADESLKVKPDGRIFQGSTRIKVLEGAVTGRSATDPIP